MREKVEENNSLMNDIKLAQQIIIKNINTLDEETRSKLFSKFQNVKYYTLTDDDRTTCKYKNCAAFASGDSICFFVNKYNLEKNQVSISKPIIVHEMNHILSGDGFIKSNRTKSTITPATGYNTIKNATQTNMGINEGITEYFAREFSDIHNYYAYPGLTDIASILCKELGFENVKKLYFESNATEFEKLIIKKFALPDDYLVKKLFEQMNKLFEILVENNLNSRQFHYNLIRCYETLATMKLNKINKALSRTIKDKELCLKKSIQFFDVEKFISQQKPFVWDNEYYKSVIENLNLAKKYLLDGKIKNSSANSSNCFKSFYHLQMHGGSIYSRFQNVSQEREKAEQDLFDLRKNKKNIILDMLHEIDNKHICNSYGYEIIELNKQKIINKLLDFLADKNDKVDLSKYNCLESDEIIGLTLFGKHKLSVNDVFKHFYPQDISVALQSPELCQYFYDEMQELYINKNFIKLGLKNNVKFNKFFKQPNKELFAEVRKELAKELKELTK